MIIYPNSSVLSHFVELLGKKCSSAEIHHILFIIIKEVSQFNMSHSNGGPACNGKLGLLKKNVDSGCVETKTVTGQQ